MFRVPKPEGIPEVTDTGGTIICRGGVWGHDYPTTCRRCGGSDTYFVEWVKPWVKSEHSDFENMVHEAIIYNFTKSLEKFCINGGYE